MKEKMSVLLSLVTVLLVGCLQDEVGGLRVASDSSAELYSVAHQTAIFRIHSSGSWKATCPADWLDIVKDKGPAGSDTLVVVTNEKNLTGNVRKALVTLEADGKQEILEISQSGEFALFNEHQYVLPSEGGAIDVTFRTNVADSLLLYVSANLADFLVDTRKNDSTENSRSRGEKEREGTLEWLEVLPNTEEDVRMGYFLLSINGRNKMRIDLDTLYVVQLVEGMDSLARIR